MNPYYQIPEENAKPKKAGVIAAVVGIALLLVLLVVAALLLPRRGQEPIYVPGETTDEETLWAETSETSPEETPAGTPGGFASVPEPGDWYTVQYYAPEVVAEWLPEVYSGLKAISEVRWDVLEQGGVQVGLFDFKCDGVPEIVLYYYDNVDSLKSSVYRADVFSIDGVDGAFMTTYEWPDYADLIFMQRASAGEVYPCTGALNEVISYTVVGDPSCSYYMETMCRLDGYVLSPLCQMRTEGDQTTYVYEGVTMGLETWNRYVNAYEQENPALSGTMMQMQMWDVDMNIYNLAMTMVNSSQQFVMPAEEAYPAG